MHGIKAGRPEIPLEFPGIQIPGGIPDRASGKPGFWPLPARSQEQDITEALFIPQHKGISPVVRVITFLGREGQCVFLPLLQVIAYGMHHDLRSFSQLGIVPVIAGVKGMKASILSFQNTACKDILVLLLIAAPWDGDPQILIGDKVRGGGKMPAERLAAGAGLSGIPLVIEIEFFPTAEGHAVAKPPALGLIIQFEHGSSPLSKTHPTGFCRLFLQRR